MEKKRLDVLLTEQGVFPSREQAKNAVAEGKIFVNGKVVTKPGQPVPEDAKIEFRGERMPFVSRGGWKLDKALRVFPIDLRGKITMDIGASTGGFTDCMLQNGAQKVYSVDVGTDQLDAKLRADPRVVNMEQTNIRNVTAEEFPERLDFFSVDVSFISLCLVLPAAVPLLKEDGEAVCLIKPQFEAGRNNIGKKGVVRDRKVQEEVVNKICRFANELGCSVRGLDFSPIKGPEGNIEFLLYLRKLPHGVENIIFDAKKTVQNAYANLSGDLVGREESRTEVVL